MRYTKFFFLLVIQLGMLLNQQPIFATLQAKAILWDMGDTLFTYDTLCAVKNIGIQTSIKFYLRHPISNKTLAKNTLWNILAQDKTYDKIDSGALDPWGAKMPSLEIAWLDGVITNQQMLEKALSLSEIYTHYESIAHKEFMQGLIRFNFGENFANCMRPIKQAVKLLHKVAAQRNHAGGRLHKLFIISNYAPEPYYKLYNNKENQKAVFHYFPQDNIFVSGLLHDSKPRLSFFKTVLDKAKIDAKNTILIDDQPENIQAAESLGIVGILWDKEKTQESRARNVCQRLKQMNILA